MHLLHAHGLEGCLSTFEGGHVAEYLPAARIVSQRCDRRKRAAGRHKWRAPTHRLGARLHKTSRLSSNFFFASSWWHLYSSPVATHRSASALPSSTPTSVRAPHVHNMATWRMRSEEMPRNTQRHCSTQLTSTPWRVQGGTLAGHRLRLRRVCAQSARLPRCAPPRPDGGPVLAPCCLFFRSVGSFHCVQRGRSHVQPTYSKSATRQMWVICGGLDRPRHLAWSPGPRYASKPPQYNDAPPIRQHAWRWRCGYTVCQDPHLLGRGIDGLAWVELGEARVPS